MLSLPTHVNDAVDDLPLHPGTTALTDTQPRPNHSPLNFSDDFDVDLAEGSSDIIL